MGNTLSRPMVRSSIFTRVEISQLRKCFEKLDLDNSGSLSVEKFMNVPGLKTNPLVMRVIEIFDLDQNGEIDFNEFVQGIAQFSSKTDIIDKLKFAFRIYDIDKDGYISNGDLYQVLEMMVGGNLHPTRMQQIVDRTILYDDKDADGKISFDEFCAAVGHANIKEKS